MLSLVTRISDPTYIDIYLYFLTWTLKALTPSLRVHQNKSLHSNIALIEKLLILLVITSPPGV